MFVLCCFGLSAFVLECLEVCGQINMFNLCLSLMQKVQFAFEHCCDVILQFQNHRFEQNEQCRHTFLFLFVCFLVLYFLFHVWTPEKYKNFSMYIFCHRFVPHDPLQEALTSLTLLRLLLLTSSITACDRSQAWTGLSHTDTCWTSHRSTRHPDTFSTWARCISASVRWLEPYATCFHSSPQSWSSTPSSDYWCRQTQLWALWHHKRQGLALLSASF